MATVRAIFDIVDTSTNQVSASQSSWCLGKVSNLTPFPEISHPMNYWVFFPRYLSRHWLWFLTDINCLMNSWGLSLVKWVASWFMLVFSLWYKLLQELLVEQLPFLLFRFQQMPIIEWTFSVIISSHILAPGAIQGPGQKNWH